MENDPEFEFQVQRAPSARGVCHGCNAKIAKEEVRIGLKKTPQAESDDEETENSEIIRWLHAKYACFVGFRDANQWIGCPNAEDFFGHDDLDAKGRTILTALVDELRGDAPPSKAVHSTKPSHSGGTSRTPTSSRKRRAPKKRSSSEGSEDEDASPRHADSDDDIGTPSSAEDESEESDRGARGRPRRSPKKKPKAKAKSRRMADADDSYDSEDDAPKKSKATPRARKGAASPGKYKCAVLSAAHVAGITEEMNKQSKKTVAQLKDGLRHNGQVVTGLKQDLVERVSEFKVIGCIPRCPKCEEGRLQFCRSTGAYTCPGYLDSEAGHNVSCTFKGTDVERVPWKN